jgi:hypothetical protein
MHKDSVLNGSNPSLDQTILEGRILLTLQKIIISSRKDFRFIFLFRTLKSARYIIVSSCLDIVNMEHAHSDLFTSVELISQQVDELSLAAVIHGNTQLYINWNNNDTCSYHLIASQQYICFLISLCSIKQVCKLLKKLRLCC